MTKKDYIVLCDILAKGWKSGTFKNMKHFNRFIYHLEDYLQADNPRFDRNRFNNRIAELLSQ